VGLPFADPTNTGQWAQDLLASLGDPETNTNIGYIEEWESHESPSGFGYNPLGTEQSAKGSTDANSAGVQAFDSWLSGIQATDATLNNGRNNALEADLSLGDASLSMFSAAQAQGSWATGAEKEINSLGTPQTFQYGGVQGEQAGVKGIASVPADSSAGAHSWFGSILTLGGHLPGGGVITDVTTAPEKAASAAVSGVFGPVAKWVEEGAADVAFIGFGMLLVVVGLIVTFKGSTEDVVDTSPAPVKAAAAAAVAT
jgi:hypothetical protein